MDEHIVATTTQALQDWDGGAEKAIIAAGHNISLASGLAGYLMLEATAHYVQASPLRAVRISHLLDLISLALENRVQQLGLWTGLVGVLYAAEYLQRLCPELAPPALAEFIMEMDERLVVALAAPPERMHYDLINGVCGFCAYALMRTDAIAGGRIYLAAEQALLRRTRMQDGVLTWPTLPKFAGVGLEAPEGHVDFGVAHGIAGVTTSIAGAMRAGLCSDRSRELLRLSVEALRAEADEARPDFTFRTDTTRHDGASRLAWCYGDVGVGTALLQAGLALKDEALCVFARKVLEKRFAAPESGFHFMDSGLCHGRAGVWHLIERCRVHIDLPVGDKVATNCLLKIVSEPLAQQVHEHRHAFLEGRAGILTALLASQHELPIPWDHCFGSGF